MTTYPTKLHEALDILKKGREFLAQPGVWIVGSLGSYQLRNKENGPMPPGRQETACSWGALSRVSNRCANEIGYASRGKLSSYDCAPRFLHEASVRAGHTSIVDMNDGHGDKANHARVLRVWDDAIARAQKAVDEYEASDPQERDRP